MTAATDAARPTLHLVRLAVGTPVMTLDGILPVEHLCPGDRLIARQGALRLVACRPEIHRHAAMLRVAPGTLGHGRPLDPMLMPADQPVLVQGARADLLHGAALGVVAAGRIADGRLNRIVLRAEARLVVLAFDEPATIYAGDLQPVTTPEPLSVSA